MLDTIKQMLASQFQAALCTLNHCVERCPEELWNAPVAKYPFCQVAFHALFFADYYLGPDIESQRTQAFHLANPALFGDYEQLLDREPVSLYTKEQIESYTNFCRGKAVVTLNTETEASLTEAAKFGRRHFSRAELHVYNIRHIQHHAAQLILRLRLDTDIDVPWMPAGWRDLNRPHSGGRMTAKKKEVTRTATVQEAVESLKRLATRKTRDGMARFAIPSDKAFGVAVGDIRKLAKALGRKHELAAQLWETGLYEPRMLACFVEDPGEVTPAQMDRWAKDFDSWAICDTACFHLFDRTPHAFRKVAQWSKRKEDFVKRAAFALLASIALHDKKAADDLFIESLDLLEVAATDPRNFVKKAVNWALRAIGKRNLDLNAKAVALSKRLADSEVATARWVGKDALRELTSPAVAQRLSSRLAQVQS